MKTTSELTHLHNEAKKAHKAAWHYYNKSQKAKTWELRKASEDLSRELSENCRFLRKKIRILLDLGEAENNQAADELFAQAID